MSPRNNMSPYQYVDKIVHFLSQYNWLYNDFGIYFFTKKLWKTIPKDWRDCLREEDDLVIRDMVNGKYKEEWPQSLKEFIVLCQILAMPRDPVGFFFPRHEERK
eukprot:TRINITY_DN3145_c0_g2_i6.p1 TRINITY_DN3145_c0_g2~~TRINITY_DN3145_c0_g2_i6.p1  ORF type:complete len:104 (+),score=17.11 TRINITY_DN3145_c0_g2_i6:771-1082(+)